MSNLTLALEIRRLRYLITLQTFMLILDGLIVLYALTKFFPGGL